MLCKIRVQCTPTCPPCSLLKKRRYFNNLVKYKEVITHMLEMKIQYYRGIAKYIMFIYLCVWWLPI